MPTPSSSGPSPRASDQPAPSVKLAVMAAFADHHLCDAEKSALKKLATAVRTSDAALATVLEQAQAGTISLADAAGPLHDAGTRRSVFEEIHRICVTDATLDRDERRFLKKLQDLLFLSPREDGSVE